MMEKYKKNLQILQDTRPDLYQELMRDTEDGGIQIENSLSGDPYFIIEKQGNVYSIGSMYSPQHEAERYIQQFKKTHEPYTIVMVGFGLGYIAQKLMLSSDICEQCIVYEPSIHILRAALQMQDLTRLFSNKGFQLYVGSDGIQLFLDEINESMDFHTWKNFRYVCLTNYHDLFPDLVQEIDKQYRIIFEHKQMDLSTLIKFSKLSSSNEIHSFRYMMHGKLFFDIKPFIRANIPCIIVAAGPSLEKNIAHLKKAQGKAFIFCVDSAAKYLVSNGIIPDMLCTIDPNKALNCFDDERLYHIPVAITTTSNARLLERMGTPEVMYYSSQSILHDQIFEWLGVQMECINAGGSVALSEFSLAIELGFKTIIIIGQDLALEDGKEYAGKQKANNADASRYHYQVEGYYGGLVSTSIDFKTYIEVYNDRISRLTDQVIINATEGGAKLQGAVQMPLEEAIDTYCKEEFNFLDIYNRIPYLIITDDRRRELLHRLQQHVDILRELYPKIKKAVIKSEQVLNHVECGKINARELEKTNQYNSELLDQVRECDASDMLYCCMMKTEESIIEVLNQEGVDPVQEIKNLYHAMIDYLSEMQETVQYLLEQWKDLFEELYRIYHLE